MEIANVTVCSASSIGKIRWFEASVTAFEGDKMIRFSVDLPVTDLKNLGVTKNMNGWKRVRAWANSDDGHAYFEKHRNRQSIMSQIRSGLINP